MSEPRFDLEEPGTVRFTALRAFQGQEINRFALSLRSAANREKYFVDPRGYATQFGVGEAELDMVEQRDWTGLLIAGGHVQALLKLAATVGMDLWDIGAHNVGSDRSTLVAVCPREVEGLPEDD